LRQTAHGSLILLLGQVASTAILAVAQIIIANLLGQERLGDYTIVFVPIGIAVLLQDLGISVGLTSHIARYHHRGLEEEKKTVLATGLVFNILISLIVASTVFLISPWIAFSFLHRTDLEALLRVASLAILGQALISTTNAIFIGYGRMKLQSLNSVILAIARIILSPLLVIIGFGTMGAVAGSSVSQILAGFIGFLLVVMLMRNIMGRIEITSMLRTLGTLIRYGLPIYMSSLIGGGLNQIYSSLMVLYVANTQIGNYSAAGYFSVAVGFVTGPISLALFPLFSKLRRGDENLARAYRSAVKYSSLFALPIAGALIALSSPIIGVIFVGRFSLAASYLQLSTLSYVYIGLGSVATPGLLNGQGETRINLRCTLIGMLTGGSLAFYLIPNFGIIGMIITMIIASLPSVVYALYWVKRNLGFGPDWRSSIKIYSSVIPSIVVTLFFVGTQSNLWIELFVGSAIFVLSYLMMIRILKVLDREDYEMFRAIVGDTGVLGRFVNPLINLIEEDEPA
jgi:O-antigen/teichoic acid export membrane protein